MYRMIYDPGMGPYPLRVALAPHAPAKERSAGGVGVSTSCGAVSTRGIDVFVTGSSELKRFGRISNHGGGLTLPPTVQRDPSFFPRGNSRRGPRAP